MRAAVPVVALALAVATAATGEPARAAYVNFESSHVHPIALTPSRTRLLAVNTPDATLEVFSVSPSGALSHAASIPVGLEPVTVAARSDTEAWVVNHLSDSISIVDLARGAAVRTLPAGDEPTDVVFAQGRAFVAVSQEDAVKVFSLADLDAPPARIDLFNSDARALAVSPDGARVYAVALHSGNQTTIVNANVIESNSSGLSPQRLGALGLNNITCREPPPRPPYPPLPPGIARNPALTDPAPPDQPPVSLVVRWDGGSGRWLDEAGQDWSNCLPFRLPDHDLFIIDAANPSTPATVRHLGTTLFDLSVNPANGRIYVPHTEARNSVRFEHPLGVQGHMVDNRIAVVDPLSLAATLIDLNSHIDRGSDPASNLPEREASISQPGMMVWNAAGSRAFLTAIGSRRLFRLDGSCFAPACIFGPDRAVPDAVLVGDGPTGVALNEPAGLLYVLNRFSSSIALVDAASLVKTGEILLHDPSPPTVRDGRRLLYDAVSSSGHGDAACSSCHVFGDRDEIAWDLGNPSGDFTPYGAPGDNVRFIVPQGGEPTEVPAQPPFAAHAGFDPQKGPMATQTLRGMLEPLHWRGDRATMNDFNQAFVSLMGTADIGPIDGRPAGLGADEMELFRRFALGIAFPPNPHRLVDDTVPDAVVAIPGHPVSGNPAVGQALFGSHPSDAAQPCTACHAPPFGAAGGKLGGLEPGDSQDAKAALFNGDADGSPHSDLKVPHLRNMHEKFGPRFGSLTNPGDPPADQKSGFGYTHDGSIPDLASFLSASVFNLDATQVRHLSMFLLHFPTEHKPSVGRHVTVPAGVPADPDAPPERLLASLIALGNAADAARHCELTAAAPGPGGAGPPRGYQLDGGIGSGGLWTTDVDGAPKVTTPELRSGAGGPVSFLCVTTGSGERVGVDRDEDGRFNASDCSDGDPAFFLEPVEVTNVTVDRAGPALLTWDDQAASVGPGLSYDVAGGSLSALASGGLAGSASCLAGGLGAPGFDDARPDPPPGEGWYYLVRARTSECSGGFGPGAASIEPLSCAP